MNTFSKTEIAANSNHSLLVVDDDELNRDLLAFRFNQAGFKVTLAEDGYAALKLIENQAFDLILLDIMMPGLSGIDVLHEIRKKHSLISLPVIMVTADDLDESVVTALENGANDYLTKPLNIPVAKARIKTQLTLKHLAALKDEFVRFASHDLKKPLLVMLDIASEMNKEMQIGKPITADNLELLNLILRTGENMQWVIEKFLDSEINAGPAHKLNHNVVNLNTIISNLLDTNSNYAKQKEIKLEIDLDTALPSVQADEFCISQILENLIGNAMKFSPRETTTTVRTYSDDDSVYAEVCDGGPGLTDDDMKKLFTRNAKLSNKPTGNETSSGIGLSMSKHFIDMHNGKIGAKNNPGKGVTFWFSLPFKLTI